MLCPGMLLAIRRVAIRISLVHVLRVPQFFCSLEAMYVQLGIVDTRIVLPHHNVTDIGNTPAGRPSSTLPLRLYSPSGTPGHLILNAHAAQECDDNR